MVPVKVVFKKDLVSKKIKFKVIFKFFYIKIDTSLSDPDPTLSKILGSGSKRITKKPDKAQVIVFLTRQYLAEVRPATLRSRCSEQLFRSTPTKLEYVQNTCLAEV